MWRGMIRVFLLSLVRVKTNKQDWGAYNDKLVYNKHLAALPASSRISADRYSSTAARYTGAPAPMRLAYLPFLR